MLLRGEASASPFLLFRPQTGTFLYRNSVSPLFRLFTARLLVKSITVAILLGFIGGGSDLPPSGTFDSKAAARQHVWDRLQAEGAAAFPFPPHARIPNFQGAAAAAKRLFGHPLLAHAGCIKVNPDAPQRPVREAALAQGTVVIVPTPRLRGGFHRLDPSQIPEGHCRQAASQKGAEIWGETLAVDALPTIDLIVTGSAAVTLEGHRCGKGHGYADLEYAVLRELSHPPIPVATTVHPIQVVGGFPIDYHDLPVSLIATPETLHEVEEPPPSPLGIDWNALDEADLRAMPVLAELKRTLDGWAVLDPHR